MSLCVCVCAPPAHGQRLRWRDKVRCDLKSFQIEERTWYQTANERDPWRAVCRDGLEAFTITQEQRSQERHTLKHHPDAGNQLGLTGANASHVAVVFYPELGTRTTDV